MTSVCFQKEQLFKFQHLDSVQKAVWCEGTDKVLSIFHPVLHSLCLHVLAQCSDSCGANT